ncbi:MAG: phospholipid carrier-dependent glycosyltransferase [Candidatus Omnitrophica bacterium]|nr:phospholipid carrier-dependent glycosyltransferase [Candidatus Omnitrophota bacterium]
MHKEKTMHHHHGLTEEQRNFIEENYKEMSLKHIAKKLNVSRSSVQKYHKYLLEEKEASRDVTEKTVAGSMAGLVKISAVFILILLFALFLRRHTFNLPHYRGDQHHYIGLAYKLDTEGVKGYNLRSINMYGVRNQPNVVVFGKADDKGHILKSLEAAGITYYDEPLHHMPWGFPTALIISHKIFAPGEPYTTVAVNDTKIIQNAPPGVGLRNLRLDPDVAEKQFYAVIVPLFCSLLTIALLFFLSKELFRNNTAALISMFLLSISPIAILTSQKVWADDLTLVLAVLGALLYLFSKNKNKPFLAFLAGLACGASVITKQNGAIIPFSIAAWHFLSERKRLLNKKTFLKVIFDKKFLLFCGGAFLSSGYWFYKITATYGNPLYKPQQQNLLAASKTAWFRLVQGRRHLYLLGIPYQNPLFTLAYISPLWLWLDKKNFKNLLFPVTWLAVSFIIAYNLLGGEHRYMLPAYPAFAILAGYVVDRIRVSIDRSMGFGTGTVLTLLALLFSVFWSVPMVMEVIFHNGALIMKPF